MVFFLRKRFSFRVVQTTNWRYERRNKMWNWSIAIEACDVFVFVSKLLLWRTGEVASSVIFFFSKLKITWMCLCAAEHRPQKIHEFVRKCVFIRLYPRHVQRIFFRIFFSTFFALLVNHFEWRWLLFRWHKIGFLWKETKSSTYFCPYAPQSKSTEKIEWCVENIWAKKKSFEEQKRKTKLKRFFRVLNFSHEKHEKNEKTNFNCSQREIFCSFVPPLIQHFTDFTCADSAKEKLLLNKQKCKRNLLYVFRLNVYVDFRWNCHQSIKLQIR